jgi:hypothetical protein
MATLTNIAKNSYIAATGGEVFYGFLFLFTRTVPASGSVLTNAAKHTGSLINISKH